MIFNLYAVVSNFTVNLAHNFKGSFSDGPYFCISCVYSHFRQKNHNRLTMSLTSPVSYVSDIFYLYRVYFLWVFCNLHHPTNQIRPMMSLTMMGLTLGPLVRLLFLFTLMNTLFVLENPLVVLTNLLVVSVAWGLKFLSQQESSHSVLTRSTCKLKASALIIHFAICFAR